METGRFERLASIKVEMDFERTLPGLLMKSTPLLELFRDKETDTNLLAFLSPSTNIVVEGTRCVEEKICTLSAIRIEDSLPANLRDVTFDKICLGLRAPENEKEKELIELLVVALAAESEKSGTIFLDDREGHARRVQLAKPRIPRNPSSKKPNGPSR